MNTHTDLIINGHDNMSNSMQELLRNNINIELYTFIVKTSNDEDLTFNDKNIFKNFLLNNRNIIMYIYYECLSNRGYQQLNIGDIPFGGRRNRIIPLNHIPFLNISGEQFFIRSNHNTRILNDTEYEYCLNNLC